MKHVRETEPVDKNINKGTGTVAVVQTVLIILKLLNVIECSYLVVFAPTLISVGISLIIIIWLIMLDMHT